MVKARADLACAHGARNVRIGSQIPLFVEIDFVQIGIN
jgi:hypothetical protein